MHWPLSSHSSGSGYSRWPWGTQYASHASWTALKGLSVLLFWCRCHEIEAVGEATCQVRLSNWFDCRLMFLRVTRQSLSDLFGWVVRIPGWAITGSMASVFCKSFEQRRRVHRCQFQAKSYGKFVWSSCQDIWLLARSLMEIVILWQRWLSLKSQLSSKSPSGQWRWSSSTHSYRALARTRLPNS